MLLNKGTGWLPLAGETRWLWFGEVLIERRGGGRPSLSDSFRTKAHRLARTSARKRWHVWGADSSRGDACFRTVPNVPPAHDFAMRRKDFHDLTCGDLGRVPPVRSWKPLEEL